MAKTHGALIRRARRTDGANFTAVLNLGASVAALAAHASSLRELNRFLDRTVLDELLAERRQLAEALDFLENLTESSAASPDIEPLAAALVRRIEKLLDREDRAFYQPLLRLAARQAEKPTLDSEEVSP